MPQATSPPIGAPRADASPQARQTGTLLSGIVSELSPSAGELPADRQPAEERALAVFPTLPTLPGMLEPNALFAIKQRCACWEILVSWRWWDSPLPEELTAEMITEASSLYSHAMQRAIGKEVIAYVERLRNHYGEFAAMTEAQAEMLHKDWLEDFHRYPRELLIEACRRWRNSNAKKAPTPGQLKAMVEDEFTDRALIGQRIAKAHLAFKSPSRRV